MSNSYHAKQLEALDIKERAQKLIAGVYCNNKPKHLPHIIWKWMFQTMFREIKKQ